MIEPLPFERRERVTRISVTGSGGSFRVQLGDEAPVRVTVFRGEAHCECGRDQCKHEASLRACGFLDDGADDTGLALVA